MAQEFLAHGVARANDRAHRPSIALVEELSGDGAVWHKAFDGSSWGN
jgi:hypothetical protein